MEKRRVKKPMVNAQTKMKALVVSRLLTGDIPNWQAFDSERKVAANMFNRAIAQHVSRQIGRTYRGLSINTQKFIGENFVGCEYHDLARLCDAVKPGEGLSIRLNDFEREFFPLSDSVKRRFDWTASFSLPLGEQKMVVMSRLRH